MRGRLGLATTRDTRADDTVKVRRAPRRRAECDGYRTRTPVRCGRRRSDPGRDHEANNGSQHRPTHPPRAPRASLGPNPPRRHPRVERLAHALGGDGCGRTLPLDAPHAFLRCARSGGTRGSILSPNQYRYAEKGHIAENRRNSRGLRRASSPQLAPTTTGSLLATSPGLM